MSTEQAPSTMPKLTFITGGTLVVVGVLGYVVSLVNDSAHWTALFPAIIGVLLVVIGWISKKNLMAGIHIALLRALVGALGMFMPLQNLGALFAGELLPQLLRAALGQRVLLLHGALQPDHFLSGVVTLDLGPPGVGVPVALNGLDLLLEHLAALRLETCGCGAVGALLS